MTQQKSFRTYHEKKRVPARPMEPVIDPAGWSPESLDDVGSWSYRLTAGDCAELTAATDAIRRKGIAPEDVDRGNFALRGFADILREVKRELLNGRGIVMLQGFPVDAL